MNNKLISLVTFSILVVVGCRQQPSTEQATRAFCQDLSNLRQQLATLSNLTPQSTVGDLLATRDRIEASLNKVKQAGSVLQNAHLDDLRRAENNFKNTVNSISKRATLAEAAAKVKQAGAQVEAARAQLSSTVQCP